MALSKAALAPRTTGGFKCSVCKALVDLPKSDSAQLAAWMSDPGIFYSAIAEACKADPDTPDLTAFQISHHARGRCGAQVKLR